MFKNKTGQEINVEGLGMMKRALKTGDNEVPALLDQLYNAGKKSGVGINEMIGTLAKAGPLLKQYGITAGQSASLLTKFDDAGVDVNKVIPAMGFAFKNSAKKGEDFGTFLRENTEKIQGLLKAGDKIGAERLAQDTFGKVCAAAALPSSRLLRTART